MSTLTKKRQEVLEYVQDHWGASPQEVARELDKTPGAAGKLMHDMYHDGQLDRVERGRYAIPGDMRTVEGPGGSIVLISTEHELAGPPDNGGAESSRSIEDSVKGVKAVLGPDDRMAKDLQEATRGVSYWWDSFVFSVRETVASWIYRLYEIVSPRNFPS